MATTEILTHPYSTEIHLVDFPSLQGQGTKDTGTCVCILVSTLGESKTK